MSDEVEDICGDIYNLAGALNCLGDVDPELLSVGRKKKLARMKRLIFDALVTYTECLPPAPAEEKNGEEVD